MRVLGTAGHVDHGKSTLVQALTGTHPDRLKEEREREMTIDLGFAFLTLPVGEEVGIVDVPGHRDFIENMLAGVGGIDAALFVVAADEGVMPQTREHLAILDLLQIGGGVVALTKTDMVADPEWIGLVEEDLRTVLAGSVLADAPIVRVSGRTKTGIPELISALTECLAGRPPRPDLGRPRLPVDRTFTISGFGTVVTGTLIDGSFQVGQEIVTQPGGVRGRIRGLQSHNQKEKIAAPGSRSAVNISGITLEQVQRGEWITLPGDYEPTRRLDVRFRQLPDVKQPVRHDMEVKFFIGAAEVVGRLRLLGTDLLPPGGEGWLQIELRDPVVAVRGDRYILRRPSPGETLGGGMVVDPQPERRHKRFAKKLIERLEALEAGSPQDVLLQAALSLGAAPWGDVEERSSLAPEIAAKALRGLLASGNLLTLENGDPPGQDTLVLTASMLVDLSTRVHRFVADYHAKNPLRLGVPREELKSRLRLDSRVFNALLKYLENEGTLDIQGALIWHPGHQIHFSKQQEQAIDRIMKRFAANPFSPPGVKEVQSEMGPDVFQALVDLGRMVPVSSDIAYRKQDFDHLLEQTKEILQQEGNLTVANFRDRFQTSRKYALAFLEYLDGIGVTVREGDTRKLRVVRG